MLAGRMTDNEIAFALHIPVDEIKSRIARILDVLDSATRDDAVAAAIERSIIDL